MSDNVPSDVEPQSGKDDIKVSQDSEYDDEDQEFTTEEVEQVEEEGEGFAEGNFGDEELDYEDEEGEGFEPPEVEGEEFINEMRSKLAEIEKEAEDIQKSNVESDKNIPKTAAKSLMKPPISSDEQQAEIDSRSVYVGNVDYGASADELEKHFHACGDITRVTILTDKYTGHPKGFAYIEFNDKDAVDTALALDESTFRGRQVKVSAKRTNKPGFSTTDRGIMRGRFRGSRGRARGRAAFIAPYRGRAMHFSPYGRGRATRRPRASYGFRGFGA